jgi:uncharacterized protein YjbI with pentapeptide repeats
MSDDRCQWKSKYDPTYKCGGSAYHDDRCTVHDRDNGSAPGSLEAEIKKRVDTGGERIDLRGCYFPKDFDPDYLQRLFYDYFAGKHVDLQEATFSGEAYFDRPSVTEWDIKGPPLGINFFAATFLQNVSFYMVKFNSVCFRGATFSKKVFFNKTTFLEEADFVGAKFARADFEGTIFENAATFDHAEFTERVFFRPHTCTINKEKEITRVSFGSESSFQYVLFLGDIRFQYVDLSQCSFLHSNIDKVDFRYCKFVEEEEGRINILKDERDADKEVQRDPKNKKFREEKYEPVRQLYLELKKNFEDKKDWNRAGDFHYGEMECGRNMYRWSIVEGVLFNLYFWASGYGERPLKALGVFLILVLLVFPLLYCLSGDGCFFQSMWNSLMVTSFGRVAKPEITSYFGPVFWLIEIIVCPTQFALFALALRRKVKR